MFIHLHSKNWEALNIERKQGIFASNADSIDNRDGIPSLHKHNTKHIFFECDNNFT